MDNKHQIIFINTSEALKNLVDQFSKEKEIAVDTESNGLFAYQEQVCLLQFTIPGKDYVVDPLVIKDLSALGPVFSNDKILKIFHAAEYDVICLKRDYGFEINNLFDTMLASRVLGYRTLGLGKILEERYAVKVQKKYQRADWGKRPLSKEMIEYATTDTRYLHRLKSKLSDELLKKDRSELAQEEFLRISRVNGTEKTTLEEHLRKLAIANRLTPQSNAVMLELLRTRDRMARKRNVPVFKVIGDKALVEVAHYMPYSQKDLNRLENISPRVISRHSRWLLEAVTKGNKKEGISVKRKKRWDGAYAHRLDLIKKWRRRSAEEMGVESDVILPREIMETLAWKNPSSDNEIKEIMQTIPWRYDRFKEDILDLFS